MTDQSKRFHSSRPIMPKIETANLTADQIQQMYYRTTTKTAFVTKDLPSNASFSDVHKAAQRIGKFKPGMAPFWSRDMSRLVTV